jgi:hypothetical protein
MSLPPVGPAVTLGMVGETPIQVTPVPADFASVATVIIGDTAYVRTLPPGWPTQPNSSPTLPPSQTGAGAATEIAPGATVTLFASEAAALVAADAATYA